MALEAYRKGAKQGPFEESQFKTIEFGFAPFVPFSQQFAMDLLGGRTGDDFKVHANSLSQGWEQGWQGIYDNYQNLSPNQTPQTIEDITKIPTGQIQFESNEMTKELADLLQGKSPIYGKYDNTEHTEIEDRIAIDWLFDGDNQWSIEGQSWKTPGVDGRREVMGKQIDAAGHEGLDLQATTEKEAEYLEYVIHRIAANSPAAIDGADFVHGAQGIEMTHMVNEKFTAKLFNEFNEIEDIGERWDAAGQELGKQVMEAYDTLSVAYKDIFTLAKVEGSDAFSKELYGSKGKAGGYDSVGYMAKQMLDRFAENLVRTNGDMAGYLWQEPLVPLGSPRGTKHTLVGFASFKPDIRADEGHSFILHGISVETFTVDITEGVTEAGFASAEEYLEYLQVAGKAGYGTLSQFLLWDNLVNFQKDAAALTQGTLALGEGLSLWTNFAGQRGEMLGSSLRYQVDDIARGAVGGSASVEAVQVLTSGEIAKGLKAKFKDFFEGKEMKGAFARFYEKAVQSANSITDAWKNKIGTDNMGLSDANNVWADYLMENDGKIGTGIGLPFFFYAGEDPEGYKRFKIRAPTSQFLLKNIRRKTEFMQGGSMAGLRGQPTKPVGAVGRTRGTGKDIASKFYEGKSRAARWNRGSVDWKEKAYYGK
jgi:hypothetical protein